MGKMFKVGIQGWSRTGHPWDLREASGGEEYQNTLIAFSLYRKGSVFCHFLITGLITDNSGLPYTDSSFLVSPSLAHFLHFPSTFHLIEPAPVKRCKVNLHTQGLCVFKNILWTFQSFAFNVPLFHYKIKKYYKIIIWLL